MPVVEREMQAAHTSLPRNMPALTGIRGWASLWVLLYHVTLFDHVPGLDRGAMGVDAFFILSGFVLSHGYAHGLARLDFGAIRTFLRGRVARIYPLHLLALGIAVAVVLAFPAFAAARSAGRFSVSAFFACLLLVQNWGFAMPTAWNSPTWSLSAEWFAYLAFPFVALAVMRLRSAGLAVGCAVVCLAVEAAVFLAKGSTTPDALGSLGMFRMACEFGAGSLLWRATWLGWRLPGGAWVPAALAFAAAAFVPSAELFALPAFAIFIVQGASEIGPAHRVLAHPVSKWLGDISFSVYLLHFIPLDLMHWAVEPAIGRPAWIACQIGFVPLVLAVSHVTFNAFEMPAKRWLSANHRASASAAWSPGRVAPQEENS